MLASDVRPPLVVLRPQQSTLRRTARRIVTIPAFVAAGLAYWTALPLLLVVAVLSDLVRRSRFAASRAVTMVAVYLACEVAGIFACAWIWLRHRDPEAFLQANFRLQCWWAGTLYRAGVRLFSLRVEVTGDETLTSGPMLVFSRHVSPIDNLLPVALISAPHQLRLRWVINRTLLRDPCLDIVGNRLPNCFVANSSRDSEGEIARVAALGRDLGVEDGVLIFPEGGLFSPARRERVIERIEAAGDLVLLERARQMEHVLPPRLGGSLALLESARGVDAVFLAHTGLEGATQYHAILGGGLVGRTIRVACWRVPAATIPLDPTTRTAWLLDRWAEVDRWVSENSEERKDAHA